MDGELAFDHLHLTKVDRRLITKACKGGVVAFLAPLDKGLSGSSVWQVRWQLTNGSVLSKYHVFKIGAKEKLRREYEAIRTIASVIEPGFPQVDFFPDSATPFALLRQEFVGDPKGEAISLRRYLERSSNPQEASDVILQLYLKRMKHWHPPSVIYARRDVALGNALDWWVDRQDIPGAAAQLGLTPLNRSLRARFGITVAKLVAGVSRVSKKTVSIPIGPIHGDLHAQNVLLDKVKHIQLIDFGWTNQEKWKAIDFLMMECSLKFIATPSHASIDDLLTMEQLLDAQSPKGVGGDYGKLRKCIHGRELEVVAHAIHAVRHCALALNTCTDAALYRLGLITLTAGLSSLPSPINRVYLLHSLAYQISNV